MLVDCCTHTMHVQLHSGKQCSVIYHFMHVWLGATMSRPGSVRRPPPPLPRPPPRMLTCSILVGYDMHPSAWHVTVHFCSPLCIQTQWLRSEEVLCRGS